MDERDPWEDFNAIIETSAAFLDELANLLDGWAKQSRSGGWSTHQVDANTKAANDCRRRAAELRLELREEPRGVHGEPE